MKFTKSEFKSMMKECLAELIKEGSFDNHLEKIVESRVKKIIPPSGTTASGLNPLSEVVDKKAFAKQIVKDMVMPKNNAIAAAMMEVAETMPERILRESGHGTKEQSVVEEKQLDILSGGNVSKWASLAFNKKGN